MKRIKTIIIIIIMAIFFLFGITLQFGKQSTEPNELPMPLGLSMRLIFQEEFNSAETALDWQDTRKPGFSFYRTRPLGWPITATDGIIIKEGILTLQEANNYANFQITTIAGKDDNGSWTGFAPTLKKGGLYFEAAIAFDPFFEDNNPNVEGCPAFWTFSAEHLYPYESRPYEAFETDFMEYKPSWFDGLKDRYVQALHYWNISVTSDPVFTSYPHRVIIVSDQIDWSSFNVFGVLWEPGKGIKTYFNDKLMRSVSLEDFQLLATADDQHFPVILGSGQWPMQVDWVRVWQY